MLFDRLKISRAGEFTCPVKSLAIFVHNQDIDYKSNELLKLLDDCREYEDVVNLQQMHSDIIPPISKVYNQE